MTDDVHRVCIRAVRFHNGGEIRLLRDEALAAHEAMEQSIISSAETLCSGRRIAGYALVTWCGDGTIQAAYDVSRYSTYANSAIPGICSRAVSDAQTRYAIHRAMVKE